MWQTILFEKSALSLFILIIIINGFINKNQRDIGWNIYKYLENLGRWTKDKTQMTLGGGGKWGKITAI